jgi:hypothetical protein
MARASNIMRGGFSAGQAKGVNGAIATALTAAGTVITDALDLTADTNVIGTCAAGAGVQLPATELGDSVEIYNGGANACTWAWDLVAKCRVDNDKKGINEM